MYPLYYSFLIIYIQKYSLQLGCHWFAGLSVKSVLGISLSKNAAGIYYLPGILFFFFSNYHDIWRHFLYFVLKCFNWSNLLVSIPFLNCHQIGSQYHIWKSLSDKYHKIIFSQKMAILLRPYILHTFDFWRIFILSQSHRST